MPNGTSLTVIVPTKNSRLFLPAHVASTREWIDLASEIIIVDSESTDGTVDFLKTEVNHPKVRYLSHPPGLYASWNFAIANVETEYVYISTTGDTISRQGLETLLATLGSLNCDVALSKPTFRTAEGQAEEITWPIDDVIESLRVTGPRKLSRLESVIFAATHPEAALLGSVASDLFRTSALKRFPFPTDFGTAGDGAWGLMHAAEISFAVVPQKFSSFLLHPTGASDAERKALKESKSANDVLAEAMERWRCAGSISNDDLQEMRWPELFRYLTSYLEAKRAFDNNRRAAIPWWLNPSAWSTRSRRNASWNKLQECKLAALAQCVD